MILQAFLYVGQPSLSAYSCYNICLNMVCVHCLLLCSLSPVLFDCLQIRAQYQIRAISSILNVEKQRLNASVTKFLATLETKDLQHKILLMYKGMLQTWSPMYFKNIVVFHLIMLSDIATVFPQSLGFSFQTLKCFIFSLILLLNIQNSNRTP